MNDVELTGTLHENMEKRGWRVEIVSIARVKELEKEIRAQRRGGFLDQDLYDEYLASFDFACQETFADARSLIIVSVPQPQARVVFQWEKESHSMIIPPTYAPRVDQHVTDLLDSHLSPGGYHVKKVRLPQKLLAVRAGLATYGKNNISYVPGMGSFHRPVVFVSDVPRRRDGWGEAEVMDRCENCNACMKACPCRAIGSDRFLLHAERCLTFHNERAVDFPEWLSPDWHNSLVGCMICQKVCPANKKVVEWIEDGATFEEEETALILEGVSIDRAPRTTLEKLDELGMMEFSDVLGRNLKAILRNRG